MKGGRDRASGVSRSGDQDRQRAAAGFAQSRHTGREEAGSEVLECRCRPMKELEHPEARSGPQRHQWRREVESFGGNGGDLCGKRVPFRKRRQQPVGNTGQIRLAAKGLRIQARPGVRHIKATIRREPLQQGCGECSGVLSIACTGEQHQSDTTRAPCD